jgi:hypothetical protein
MECGGLTPLWMTFPNHPKRRQAAALQKRGTRHGGAARSASFPSLFVFFVFLQ